MQSKQFFNLYLTYIALFNISILFSSKVPDATFCYPINLAYLSSGAETLLSQPPKKSFIKVHMFVYPQISFYPRPILYQPEISFQTLILPYK